MEQARVRAGKSERDGIPVFDTPADKPDNQCSVIGRIAEHTSEPGLLQTVILNGIVMSRRIPWAVYGRTRIQIERPQPSKQAGRREPFVLSGRRFPLESYIHDSLDCITRADLDIERVEIEFMGDIGEEGEFVNRQFLYFL